MHLARRVVLVLGLAAMVLPGPFITHVLAQQDAEIPPLPRPRPDRTAPPNFSDATGTDATAAIAAVTNVPQPVTLSARITPESPEISSGLVWRVFESQPDENGEIALVAKADTGIAELELPPGEYNVHVSYGNAQLGEPLSVVPGQNQKELVLDAGGLRLNSAVTGEVPISPNLLKFDIMTAGAETSRAIIVADLPANQIVTLNAGTYHIVSHFGAINAVVEADLRVEPGELTEATLYHHASEVSFKLVSETGGEAIADVEWTVKTTDGATIFTERGAFPSTVLAEGEYLVLAKLGDQVYNREVEIKPGSPQEIEVLSSVY